MIDYFIMSRPLVAAIISCEADFSVPFGPHYGLKLKFKAELSKILCKTLIKAEMPKKFARPEAKVKIVAKNKIELEKARGARRLEEALESKTSENIGANSSRRSPRLKMKTKKKRRLKG